MMLPLATTVSSIMSVMFSFAAVMFFLGVLDDGPPWKRRRRARGMGFRPTGKLVRCPRCHGSGRLDSRWTPCGRCKGSGHLGPEFKQRRNPLTWFMKEKKSDEK